MAAARWDEIDLESKEWWVSAEKMKMGFAHVVPLPTQAADVLRGMLPFSAGTHG